MRHVSSLCTVLVVAGLVGAPATLFAQPALVDAPATPAAAAPARTLPPTATEAAWPVGPVAAPVGVDRRMLQRDATAPAVTQAAAEPHEGTTVALMVVGVAALVTGLIIGDDVGTALAVGGTIIGLVGLFRYIR